MESSIRYVAIEKTKSLTALHNRFMENLKIIKMKKLLGKRFDS